MAQVVTSWETVTFNSYNFIEAMDEVKRCGNFGFELKGFSSEICPDNENRWNAVYNVIMQRPSSVSDGNNIKYP